MNIVLAANDSYMEHLAVTLTSLLINSSKEDEFTIFILSNDISEKSKQRLEKLKRYKNFEINYIKIDNNYFKNLPTRMHYTSQIYYRLLMPKLLKEKKVLYLDSDIIVRKPLKDFYNTDLKENITGVISDIIVQNSDHAKKLDIEKYFNSGVMLWDLDKAREENISEKCIEFIFMNSDNLLYYDQDALNCICKNFTVFLDKKYNFQYNPYVTEIKNTYNAEKKNICILHFVSAQKPWDFKPKLKFALEYYNYALKTPWRFDAIKHIFSLIGGTYIQKIKKTIAILDCYS